MEPARTLAVVGVLGLVAFTILAAMRMEKPWLQPWALVRATAQLALLSLVLAGMLAGGWWVLAFVALMLAAATWVVCQRLALHLAQAPVITLMLSVAAGLPLGIVFGSGGLDLTPRYLLATSGIVIGGAMSVASLMGRTLRRLLVDQRAEIEAWLTLGATMRVATGRAVREAGATALMPNTDQTRTTGLVALPGAFVGAVFAGASPAEAAQFQLVVLSSILAAGAITVLGMAWIFGAPATLGDSLSTSSSGRTGRRDRGSEATTSR